MSSFYGNVEINSNTQVDPELKTEGAAADAKAAGDAISELRDYLKDTSLLENIKDTSDIIYT